MRDLFSLSNSVPENASVKVAVPCPVSGTPVSFDALGDDILISGAMGHGYALLSSASQIVAPLAGRIIHTSALDYAVTLRAKNGLLLRVKTGVSTLALMGEQCRLSVAEGQHVDAGDTLYVVSPPFLKKCGISSVCIVTVLNSDKLGALVPTSLPFCNATDDTLFTVYR